MVDQIPAIRTLVPYWHEEQADPEWLAMAEVAGVILHGKCLLDSATCRALSSRIRAASSAGRPLLVTADPSSLWQSSAGEQIDITAGQSPAQIGDDYTLSREAMEVTLAGLAFGRWLVERDIDAVLSPSLDLAGDDGTPGSFSRNAEIVAAAAGAYLDGLQAAGVLACGSFSHHGDELGEDTTMSLGGALAHGLEWLRFSSSSGWRQAASWLRQELGFAGPLMSPLLDDLVRDDADEIEMWAQLMQAGYDLVPIKATDLRRRLMRRLSEENLEVPADSRLRVETLMADWLGD